MLAREMGEGTGTQMGGTRQVGDCGPIHHDGGWSGSQPGVAITGGPDYGPYSVVYVTSSQLWLKV